MAIVYLADPNEMRWLNTFRHVGTLLLVFFVFVTARGQADQEITIVVGVLLVKFFVCLSLTLHKFIFGSIYLSQFVSILCQFIKVSVLFLKYDLNFLYKR